MSISIQETDQEPMKKKKQMRKLSYVNNGGSNSNDSCYELRKDPKKTPKVKDTSEVENNNNCFMVLDKLCKECGKGFQSWKALFGHMKCHSEKVSSNNLNQESWISRLDNENSGTKLCRIKKSRSRKKGNKRYVVTSTTVTTTTIIEDSSSISMNTNKNNNHGSTSMVSDIEQDQETEIAMCLIMLSRDEGKWGSEIGSSDHCKSSAFVKLTKTNGSKIKKSVETQIGSTGLEKNVIENDGLDDEIEFGFGKYEEPSKRKFKCITCNKSFHSYQALGGHKASHKKLKETLDSKTEGENTIEHKPMFNHEHMSNGFNAKPSDNHHQSHNFNLGGVGPLKKTIVLGAHECQICLKVFSSGQALGGHKRSHMIAEVKKNQQTNMSLIEKVKEPIRDIRGFLDLNMLPDTMEEDVIMNSGTTKYKPWVDTTNHESTTLLGLF
ncbi:putative transcription factor C2H2 family [Helianthus annuus]|nr:putative transcription factor C2H2 family [Helianthus annuus]KAJ0834247.1 putative transcription factor C2H2 family [Helianthus annuus]